MRVSRRFKLGLSQSQLEFVDVDLDRDIAFFVDPRALRLLDSDWADECVALVQDFFRYVLSCIANEDHDQAQNLLRVLREPNETHLGLSKGKPRGHGLGDNSAVNVWKALARSQAVRSGLLEDLEDTVLMVEGISNDIISDITTNIIRSPLIEFTQESCSYYQIPMDPEVESGPIWDPQAHQWNNRYERLPVVDGHKLLLVPKAIVRKRLEFTPDDYYTHYILQALREAELNANSGLVELLKNGSVRVTRKSLEEKYGKGKKLIAKVTVEHPELLEQYRADKTARPTPPLDHDQLSTEEEVQRPDWDGLLDAIRVVAPGSSGANAYHRAVEALMQTLFYPALTNPVRESRLHDGRKRIDIRFTNAARQGFFWRVPQHHGVPAGFVVVECKNYTEDVSNAELDQLAGRFSPARGRLGLLVFRSADNMPLCIQRCKDAFHDDRGWMLPVSDSDLQKLVDERAGSPHSLEFRVLEERFAEVIS